MEDEDEEGDEGEEVEEDKDEVEMGVTMLFSKNHTHIKKTPSDFSPWPDFYYSPPLVLAIICCFPCFGCRHKGWCMQD